MGRSTIAQNMRWGVARGLSIASLYCLWVTGVFAFHGGAPFARQGVTYGRVIAAYLVIGVGAGLVVGALRPLTRWKAGAYLVGSLGGILIAAGIVGAVAGMPSHWDGAAMSFLPVYGGLVGCFALGPALAKPPSVVDTEE